MGWVDEGIGYCIYMRYGDCGCYCIGGVCIILFVFVILSWGIMLCVECG